ncbi:hypothetical protein [Streptomyces sp. NBC_00005]
MNSLASQGSSRRAGYPVEIKKVVVREEEKTNRQPRIVEKRPTR